MVNKTGENKMYNPKKNKTISDFKPITITDTFTLPTRILPKTKPKKS